VNRMADRSEPNSEGPGPPEPGGYSKTPLARVWSKVRPVVVMASWLAGATQHQGLTGLRPSPTSHVRTPLEQNLTQEVKFEKPSFLAQALGGTVIAADLAFVLTRRRR
jgi:hypothetical protein